MNYVGGSVRNTLELGTAHPIGIPYANGFRYLPDGFASHVVRWGIGNSYRMGSFFARSGSYRRRLFYMVAKFIEKSGYVESANDLPNANTPLETSKTKTIQIVYEYRKIAKLALVSTRAIRTHNWIWA